MTEYTTNVKDDMYDRMCIPKKQPPAAEVEKGSNIAAQLIELLKHSSQYTVLLEKFSGSYHHHFGYPFRLSDYGFTKLIDLIGDFQGIVEVRN